MLWLILLTLSHIIMEVEHGSLQDEFPLNWGNFSLPGLLEEGYLEDHPC